MKRLIVCTLLIIPFLTLQAQEPVQEPATESEVVHQGSKARFGLIAGVQLTTFQPDAVGNPSSQGGYLAGFTYRMPITRGISLEPQVFYSKKGGEIDEYSSDYYDGAVNFRLHYLEGPVLLNFRTGKVLDFVAGAYGGYLIDATYSIDSRWGYGVGELDYGDFEKYDYGLIGGFGFNLPPAKFSVRYSHGMRDVLKDTSQYPELTDAKNQMVTFSLTVYL